MLRLYLDWNVINGMRKSNEGDDLFKLRKYIEENRPFFEIYYSHAHLADLAGHKKTLDCDTISDLDYLSQLTSNLAFNIRKEGIQYGPMDPNEWYKDIIENSNLLEAETLDDLIKDFAEDDPDFFAAVSQHIAQLKSIPVPEEMCNLEFLYPGMTGNTLYDATNAMLKMQKNWRDTDAYGKVRTILQDTVKANPSIISSSQDPFSAIEKAFNALGHESSYAKVKETVKNATESIPKHGPAWFDEITSTYLGLDMYGYSQDDIKIKDSKLKTFNNTVNDAQHAAFASMCHLYIIQDNKARRKTAATYKQLGINTIIMNPDEKKDPIFSSFTHGEFLISPGTPSELISLVLKQLNSNKLLDEECNDGEKKIIAAYPNCSYYGFFNKIIVIPEQKQFQIVLGTRQPANWQGLTIKAIVKLANLLITKFGIPECGRKQIETSDLDEVLANTETLWALKWDGVALCLFMGQVQIYFPWVPLPESANDKQ